MKNSYNLSFGFLFLYDWMPVLEHLSGEEFKALFRALVERQRDGIPIPQLDGALTQMFASVIEPTIIRRLEGQKGGRKTQSAAKQNPLPDSATQASTQATAQASTQATTQATAQETAQETAQNKDLPNPLPYPPTEAIKEKKSKANKKTRSPVGA